MFGLLYGLFEQAFAKKEYYALILGLDNAGKTVRRPPPPKRTTTPRGGKLVPTHVAS